MKFTLSSYTTHLLQNGIFAAHLAYPTNAPNNSVLLLNIGTDLAIIQLFSLFLCSNMNDVLRL